MRIINLAGEMLPSMVSIQSQKSHIFWCNENMFLCLGMPVNQGCIIPFLSLSVMCLNK